MRSARWTRAIVGAIAGALAICATVSGCSSAPLTAGAPDPGLRGQWVLADGSDIFGRMKLLGQDISLTITGDAISNGRASCSDYTATIYGSERSLWVTADTPQAFTCTTADQSVLQLEYLTDLRSVSHSSVTAGGLVLSGRDAELHFVRATTVSLAGLLNRVWQLKTKTKINLHEPAGVSAESGGYLRFDTKQTFTAVSRCVTFNGHYRQEANQLVASHVLAARILNCDQSADQAGSDFTRIFDGGFTFALTRDLLAVKSARAGLALGFSEVGHPVIRRSVARSARGVLGVTVLLITLAGCASARGGGSGAGHDDSITGAWHLVSGSDERGPVTPGDATVTFILDGRNSGGHGPCNSFGATTTGTTTGPVTIRLGIHTEIACVDDDLNTTEARYFAALDKVTTARLINGSLVLAGGGGQSAIHAGGEVTSYMRKRMATAVVAIGAVTLVAGCAATPPGSAPDPQLAGTWHLVVATERGTTVASGAEEITLTIADSGTSGGSSPCSFYTASITGGLGAIFIDAGIINRGADCSDAALLHIDDQYIAALDATTVASIDDGVLVLSSPRSSLVFIKPTASSLGTLQNTNWSLLEPPNLRDSTAVRLTFGSANQLTVTTRCSQSIARYLLIEDIIILRGVQTTPIGKHRCSTVDRAAQQVLSGQLTADVSSGTISGPATLILTNRATRKPMLWRAG